MAIFNPRNMTSIGKYGDEVRLRSDGEKDFQRYVYEKFIEKGCINRSFKRGYTLAYGVWNDRIHRNWFLPDNISWHVKEAEWLFDIDEWHEHEKKWIWIKRFPDFIFVVNKGNGSTPDVYVIWEVKKAWLECGSQRCQERGENGERWTSYRYCVHPSSRLRCNEIKIHKHDADFENRDNLRYCIVQSNSLDGLKSRAENQARKYAEMLRMVIPNTNAKIYYRSVIFVLYTRRDPNIAEVNFGYSKTLHY